MKRNSQRKHSLCIIGVLLAVCLLIYFVFPRPSCSLSSLDKRAVWLSYQDLAKLSYESQKEFESDFEDVLMQVDQYKTNTLIVQVRPFADALYQSKLFPISKVICQRSSLSFDPLEIMVQMVHQKGMSIEAWINPYRISLTQKTYQNFLDLSPL